MESASQPNRGRATALRGKAKVEDRARIDRRLASHARAREALREDLRALDVLLAAPIAVEGVGSHLLERVHAVFPSRQSALFVVSASMDEGSEWDAAQPLDVAAVRGPAFDEEEAIWIEGVAREALTHCQVLGRESRASALASFLWVPILHRGRRMGVLQLGDDHAHALAGTLPRELGVLADDLGAVLTRVREHQQLQGESNQRTNELAALKRECRHLRRERRDSRARDFLLQTALRRAERRLSTDPAMEALAADLRELQCGDSAPETWVDLRDLVVRSLGSAQQFEGEGEFFALRSVAPPPVRCQRLRVEGLIGALIARALEAAESDARGWIELRTRPGGVECEIGVEGGFASASKESHRGWFEDEDARDAAIDLAQDQGGDLCFDRDPERARVILTLPVDSALG